MAVTVDPTVPADSEALNLGASRIRNLSNALIQLFGEPAGSPFTWGTIPFVTDGAGNITFPGNVNLAANPVTGLQAATKQYVDASVGGQAGNFSGVAAGTNTYASTLSNVAAQAPSSLANLIGQTVIVGFVNGNTGAATINFNSFGAVPITKNGAAALTGGEISSGQWALLTYDGTEFQLVAAGGGGGGSGSYSGVAGGTNAYTVTLTTSGGGSPGSIGAISGVPIAVQFTNANTSGTVTLNANGFGAKNITRFGTSSVVVGDIPPNGWTILVYDGTEFQLLNPSAPISVAITGTPSAAGQLLTSASASTAGWLAPPHGGQVFNGVGGTFTVPSNVYSVKFEVYGAGGGGGGYGSGNTGGGTGGSTTIGGAGVGATTLTASGGVGGAGQAAGGIGFGAAGGIGTNGILNNRGGPGFSGNVATTADGVNGGGGAGGWIPGFTVSGGGSGGGAGSHSNGAGGGGAGGYAMNVVATTPGATFTVTVGTGGPGGTGGIANGNAGGNGSAVVTW